MPDGKKLHFNNVHIPSQCSCRVGYKPDISGFLRKDNLRIVSGDFKAHHERWFSEHPRCPIENYHPAAGRFVLLLHEQEPPTRLVKITSNGIPSRFLELSENKFSSFQRPQITASDGCCTFRKMLRKAARSSLQNLRG